MVEKSLDRARQIDGHELVPDAARQSLGEQPRRCHGAGCHQDFEAGARARAAARSVPAPMSPRRRWRRGSRSAARAAGRRRRSRSVRLSAGGLPCRAGGARADSSAPAASAAAVAARYAEGKIAELSRCLSWPAVSAPQATSGRTGRDRRRAAALSRLIGPEPNGPRSARLAWPTRRSASRAISFMRVSTSSRAFRARLRRARRRSRSARPRRRRRGRTAGRDGSGPSCCRTLPAAGRVDDRHDRHAGQPGEIDDAAAGDHRRAARPVRRDADAIAGLRAASASGAAPPSRRAASSRQSNGRRNR